MSCCRQPRCCGLEFRFSTLHRPFKIPNVHSTSFCNKDLSHWENESRNDYTLHCGTIVDQFIYPFSTITYAPLIVVVVAPGSTWAFSECFADQFKQHCWVQSTLCSSVKEESKQIRVLSLHLQTTLLSLKHPFAVLSKRNQSRSEFCHSTFPGVLWWSVESVGGGSQLNCRSLRYMTSCVQDAPVWFHMKLVQEGCG